MKFPQHRMGVQPADLIHNRLLGLHLYVLVDRHPDVVPLDRRYGLNNFLGHILRIYGNGLVAVFPAQLPLVLLFEAIRTCKFFLFIH
ncbi:hypothetical protein D3C86_1920950 [compost metagenome]